MSTEHKKEYDKQYYIKNKEKSNEYTKKYRKNNPEKVKEQWERYYSRNKEKILEYGKQWYKKNHKELLKKGKQYRKDHSEQLKQWRDNHLEEAKEARLIRGYNLTLEVWLKIFENQNGRCAICGKPIAGAFKACVDHNHETGEIRGLLCRRCNSGIGQFGDNPKLMIKAIRYLLGRKDK